MSKLFAHPLVVFLITVASLVFIFSLDGKSQTKNSQETIAHLKTENEKISQEIEGLKENLGTAQTTFAKEKIIRDELLMQKPGEYVVQIVGVEEVKTEKTMVEKKRTPIEEWRNRLF